MSFDFTALLQVVFGILLPAGALLSITIWSVKNGIVPMPSTHRQSRCILQNLPQDPGPLIFDLGSGLGTLAISLARHFPKSEIIGVESSPIPYWISRIVRFLLRIKNLSFTRQDILQPSLSNASAVVVYLHRAGIRNLKPKLEQELKPGAWVLSNTFAFPDWKPVKVVNTGDFNNTKIYVYRALEKPPTLQGETIC
jgi:SAM-dependent methyltransferase